MSLLTDEHPTNNYILFNLTFGVGQHSGKLPKATLWSVTHRLSSRLSHITVLLCIYNCSENSDTFLEEYFSINSTKGITIVRDEQMGHRILTIAVALALVFLPAFAQAKAGKGASMGSRGSRTFQMNNATPIQKSASPPPPIAAPRPPSVQTQPLGTQPTTARPQPNPGFFQRHPLLGGLMGGFLGAGIGSLLFGGSGFFGSGIGGIASLLLQLLLIILGVRLALSFFRRKSSFSGDSVAQPHIVASPAPKMLPPQEFPLLPTDLTEAEQILSNLQEAWSHADEGTLRRLATGELAGYLIEQLHGDRTKGVENHVEQVKLLHGDVEETWRENGFDYATVRMGWSAVDYTLRTDSGQIVEGDPHHPIETAEVWTLIRHPGDPWQISAIQQV